MEQNKPSTADILAKIRAQKAGNATAASTPVPAAPAESPPAAEPAAEAPEMAAQSPAAPAKPAAPAAKPGSTKDILAAIRAGKGGAAAPAAESAPAVSTAPSAAPAAPAKPAARPAGPMPSVQEMLKAVREGKPAAEIEAEQAKPAKVAPPMPAKQVIPAKKTAAPAPARRSLSGIVTVAAISLGCFVLGGLTGSAILIGLGVVVWGALMTPFVAAWASIGAVTGISILGTARFMFPNVLVEPPSKFKVGPPSDYPLNTVSNKWKDQFGVWIVHTDQYEGKNLLYALTSVCTHLGCTPNWLDGEQKFKCPCHGSGFYITGVNFEGPAPRPLERAGIRIAEDGMLEVDKSVKFQEEMGQWIDAASFVEA